MFIILRWYAENSRHPLNSRIMGKTRAPRLNQNSIQRYRVCIVTFAEPYEEEDNLVVYVKKAIGPRWYSTLYSHCHLKKLPYLENVSSRIMYDLACVRTNVRACMWSERNECCVWNSPICRTCTHFYHVKK